MAKWPHHTASLPSHASGGQRVPAVRSAGASGGQRVYNPPRVRVVQKLGLQLDDVIIN
jgi:hypothetical protein